MLLVQHSPDQPDHRRLVGEDAYRVSLCRKRGIPAATTFASIVYENALILTTALLVTAASVPFWPAFRHEEYALSLVALAPVCLALLHPAVFGRLANYLLARTGKSPLKATLPYGRVLALIPYYLMGWALLGLGFAALAASVAQVRPGDSPCSSAATPSLGRWASSRSWSRAA